MAEMIKVEPDIIQQENILNASTSQSWSVSSAQPAQRHKPKKRRIDTNNRKFKSCWSEKYFFFPVGDKPVCLICKETRSVNKEFNLRRHYQTKHSDYNAFVGQSRKDKFVELQRSYSRCMYDKQNAESANTIRASIALSEIIAKELHSYTDGKFLKECFSVIMDVMFPEKKALMNSIDLSPVNICHCIKDISVNLKFMLRERASEFEFYSVTLFLDELLECKDSTQLSVCVRGIDENFLITEELAGCIYLKDKFDITVISPALHHILEDIGLNLRNLCGIMSDGTVSLVEKVIPMLENEKRDLGLTPKIFKMHCIIHQSQIWAKSDEMNNTLGIVREILYFTNQNFFDHSQFQNILIEKLSKINDPYLCEIDGHLLLQIYKLREELSSFMQSKGKIIPELNDVRWLADLAFFIDMTNHLNDLNTKLQGKNLLINEMFDYLRAFEMKLRLWESQIQNNNFAHFPILSECVNSGDLTRFIAEIQYLRAEFSSRLSDIHAKSIELSLFSSPFHVDIDDSPFEFQMELVELQCNSHLKSQFQDVPLLTFYKNYLPQQSFPLLTNHAKKMTSLFGNNYLSEQLFSKMLIARSKKRTLFNDEYLECCLRIGTTNLESNIHGIVKEIIDPLKLD